MSARESESHIDNDGQRQEIEWNQPRIVDDNVASCHHASDATAIQAPVLDNPAVVASKLRCFLFIGIAEYGRDRSVAAAVTWRSACQLE